MFTIITGSQFGDEGKGKVVDMISDRYDLVARFQGGDNAGHTVVVNDIKYKLHQIPSGILVGSRVLIGAGVVMNPLTILDEIRMLRDRNIEVSAANLGIDEKTSVIMPYHITLDSLSEAGTTDKIGTTKKGIGFAYQDKVSRYEITMGDLCGDEARFRTKAEDIFRKKAGIIKAAGIDPATVLNDDVFESLCEAGRKLRDHMTDASLEINRALAEGKNVLAEGAQGSHLDVIHGTQKYVTSSSTVAGSACTGLGVGPMKVTDVIGIVKAYITRVGEGPLPTELKDETGDRMAEVGGEYGTTTGRKRRCGWFDLPLLLKAVNLNGYSEIALTKIDVLTGLDPIKVCVAYDCCGEKMSYPPLDTAALAACRPVYEELPGWTEDLTGIRSYEDLPENAKAYIRYLEDRIGVPIRYISVGPGREQTFLNPAHE